MSYTPFTWPAPLYRRPFNLVLWGIARINTILRGVPFKRFSHITPNLFVGGKLSRAGWARLESWGVSVLVNLRVEFDDLSLGIHPHTYLWLPTIDGTPPTLEQLTKAAHVVRPAVAEGRKIYVHCAAGVGRAPTTAAAYLVTTGMTPAEAVALIRRRRPFVQLSRWQRRRLEEFAAHWEKANEGKMKTQLYE